MLDYEIWCLQYRFNHQLSRDQQGALCPDCKQPFRNWPDAIKRLVRYHVFNTAECNPDDVQKGNYFRSFSVSNT